MRRVATTWPDLRARVLGDPDLQARLRAATSAETFAGVAAQIAGEPVALDPHLAVARREWFERGLPDAAPPLDADEPPAGWTPVHVYVGAGEPRVEWRDLRGLDGNRDAFFADTLQRALREPYRLLARAVTPIGALESVAPAPVAGIVHHLSRCGSTLACRMLATDPGLAVVPEPEPLDRLLSIPADPGRRARWVRGLLSALAPEGRRLVVKPDAWSLLEDEVLRAALPDTPRVLLTREPAEIIASHLRQPGSHMIPGAVLGATDLDPQTALALPRADYCAVVLRRLTDAARKAVDARTIVVDYAELPGAVTDRVCPHFGVVPDRARMLAAAAADAKRPHERFDTHRDRAERPLTDEVRAAAATVGTVAA